MTTTTMECTTVPPTRQRRHQDALSKPESGQVPILEISIDDIIPSPENDKLYRPIDPDDPEIIGLAKSIRRHGMKEPLLVTADHYIISGHRRFAAARLAGLQVVPCRVEPIERVRDHDRFVRLLRECNRQRVKSRDELLREEVLTVDPHQAYRALIDYREAQAAIDCKTITLRGAKPRAEITAAKQPLLAAIKTTLGELRQFLPVSVRRIHYGLLNNPPLIHAGKPGSRYENNLRSYKALDELLTRARIAGLIPMDAIDDETRPISIWDVHPGVQSYLQAELDKFLKGYWRDLLQSQPNHIEIIGEKNTLAPIIRPIAMRYCMPLTLGRGFCSLPPRHNMAQRFEASGKQRLVLLILSDFDPDGEEIAHSFSRSMRDDFGIDDIDAVKVALTSEQVAELKLPPKMEAKKSSTNYKRFHQRYGSNVFELEAVPPTTLQHILEKAIDSVLDVDAFNAEVEAEHEDSVFLERTRVRVYRELSELLEDNL